MARRERPQTTTKNNGLPKEKILPVQLFRVSQRKEKEKKEKEKNALLKTHVCPRARLRFSRLPSSFPWCRERERATRLADFTFFNTLLLAARSLTRRGVLCCVSRGFFLFFLHLRKSVEKKKRRRRRRRRRNIEDDRLSLRVFFRREERRAREYSDRVDRRFEMSSTSTSSFPGSEKLLDFSQPFEVTVLDAVVNAFYSPGGNCSCAPKPSKS